MQFKQINAFALSLLYFSTFICVSKGIFNCPSNFDISEVGMTPENRQEVLDAHNDCRRKIAAGDETIGQPKACDMLEMQYDMNLEVAARKLVAETCVFDHVRITDARWFAVGQNLYLWKGTDDNPEPNWSKAVTSWFEEYKLNYTYPKLIHGTGHYTQVIWATSCCLGCSYIYYRNPQNHYSFQKLYVCNYGPAGNIVNKPPYKTSCTTNCILKNGLCTPTNPKCSGVSNVSDFSQLSSFAGLSSEYD